MKDKFDLDVYEPYTSIGSLVPHVKLRHCPDAFSLREFMSKYCLKHHIAAMFVLLLRHDVNKIQLETKLYSYRGEYKVTKDNAVILIPDHVNMELADEGYDIEILDIDENDMAKLRNTYAGQTMLIYRNDGHLIFKA